MADLFDDVNTQDLPPKFTKNAKQRSVNAQFRKNVLMLFEMAQKQHGRKSLTVRQMTVAYERTFGAGKTVTVMWTCLHRMAQKDLIAKVPYSKPLEYKIYLKSVR